MQNTVIKVGDLVIVTRPRHMWNSPGPDEQLGVITQRRHTKGNYTNGPKEYRVCKLNGGHCWESIKDIRIAKKELTNTPPRATL